MSRTAEVARETAAAIRESRRATEPVAANERTMALCRLLIPVNYTRSGPFEHDLALGTKPVSGLSDAAKLASLSPGSDEYFFLRAKLERARNRVEHALRAAMRMA